MRSDADCAGLVANVNFRLYITLYLQPSPLMVSFARAGGVADNGILTEDGTAVLTTEDGTTISLE